MRVEVRGGRLHKMSFNIFYQCFAKWWGGGLLPAQWWALIRGFALISDRCAGWVDVSFSNIVFTPGAKPPCEWMNFAKSRCHLRRMQRGTPQEILRTLTLILLPSAINVQPKPQASVKCKYISHKTTDIFNQRHFVRQWFIALEWCVSLLLSFLKDSNISLISQW